LAGPPAGVGSEAFSSLAGCFLPDPGDDDDGDDAGDGRGRLVAVAAKRDADDFAPDLVVALSMPRTAAAAAAADSGAFCEGGGGGGGGGGSGGRGGAA
jgi:hypothetical protein